MIARIEAQRRIAALTLAALPSERVALADAVGRTLAAAPASDLDLPPFHRVTMDGFAVRAGDVIPESPLRVVAAVAAGQASDALVAPGHAIRIMTGAPLPSGADAVIPIEEATADADSVRFRHRATPGQNVHPRANDLRRGDRPLAAGTRVTSAMVPLLATLGCVEVEVTRRPRVALLATGDELVEIAQVPRAAQIRESNRHGLAAQTRSAGGVAQMLPITRDEPAAIVAAALAAGDADLLLLTGGSSVGDFDFAHDVLASLGATVRFDGVRIKPGKPVILATWGHRVIFCLPGNPVSAFVTFELLVRPLIERMAGARAVWPVAQTLPLASALKAPAERDLLQVARYEASGDGRVTAAPLRWSGSGDLVAIAGAAALIQLPRGEQRSLGEDVRVVPLVDRADGWPRAKEPIE